MGTRINTNMSAILATLNLNRSFASAQTSIQKLSSGLRIISPSDDIPGLAISQRLNADAVGFVQSARNAAEGVNMIQMADTAASGVVDILNKIRTLSLSAANGTIDSAGRQGLGVEFTALKSEVQRILATTKYGDIFLLATTNSSGTTGVNGTAIASSQVMSGLKFALGPAANNLVPFTFANNIISVEESLRTTSGGSQLQFGTMSSISSAKSVLTAVDSAVRSMSFFRGALGGMQDTLIQAQKSDENTNANLTAALSNIRDVDFATEVANFTSKSILTQAGMAFLAQANLLQQSVLTLLG